jgi:hypothetical protein
MYERRTVSSMRGGSVRQALEEDSIRYERRTVIGMRGAQCQV